MVTMLAPYHSPTIDEASPVWADISSRAIFDYLHEKGMEIGDPNVDNGLLFVGETSPDIHMVAAQNKRFSILLFQPNVMTSLSETVLSRVTTLYVVNFYHRSIIRRILEERFAGRDVEIRVWPFLPKPFEPPQRSKKLIGIFEPDFNANSIFDAFYTALNSAVASAVYPLDFDIAFYTLKQETNDKLQHARKDNTLSLYHLTDPINSPLKDITLMPNAILSLDTYFYNPMLSSFGQIIPVMKPAWTFPKLIERTALDLMSPIVGPKIAYGLITNFVNQIRRVEDLEVSPRIPDQMTRAKIYGEIYGDYSKLRRFLTGG